MGIRERRGNIWRTAKMPRGACSETVNRATRSRKKANGRRDTHQPAGPGHAGGLRPASALVAAAVRGRFVSATLASLSGVTDTATIPRR